MSLAKKQIMERMMALCVVAIVAALGYIAYWGHQWYVNQAINRNVSNMYENLSRPPSDIYTATTTSVTDSEETVYIHEEEDTETELERLLRLEREGRELFAALLEQNEDFLGMLIIEGLGMQLPFVQGNTNDTYLGTDFNGKSARHGTIFLNADNNRLLTDRNNVLFGHYMNDGSMFTPLMQYRRDMINTVKKAPTVVIDSLTGRTTWLVFAAYITDPMWGYIEPSNNEIDFEHLLEEINSRSIFHTNVEVTSKDKILTLSTCAYEFEDARLAVHARLLRPGEEIPEVTVEKNPKPKPWDVPNQLNFSEIPANNSAVMKHPKTMKTYYYHVSGEGIEWYVGNTSKVQGIYNCFSNTKLLKTGVLSVAYDPGVRRTWMAAQGITANPGIYMYISGNPSGPFRAAASVPVTTSGKNVRWPLLTMNGDTMWLVYTSDELDGRVLYRQKLSNGAADGAPEMLYISETGSELKAIGMYLIDGRTMLVWQEKGQGFGMWLGQDKKRMTVLDDYDRITLYSEPSNGKIPMLREKNGSLSASEFDISWLGEKTAAVTPEPKPDDTPDDTASGTSIDG